MAEHNSRFLIELDGNKPPEELFMVSVMFSKNIPILKIKNFLTELYLF